jgi:hypothetical protein
MSNGFPIPNLGAPPLPPGPPVLNVSQPLNDGQLLCLMSAIVAAGRKELSTRECVETAIQLLAEAVVSTKEVNEALALKRSLRR